MDRMRRLSQRPSVRVKIILHFDSIEEARATLIGPQ